MFLDLFSTKIDDAKLPDKNKNPCTEIKGDFTPITDFNKYRILLISMRITQITEYAGILTRITDLWVDKLLGK